MVHIGIDIGGTFTDLFALDPEGGSIVTEKADTTDDGVSGVLAALAQAGIASHSVESVVLGATTATNALAQRRIERVAFLGTHGFTDTLEIRRAWREHLFGWRWERPVSLVPHDLRFGIPGRIDWRGREAVPLDLAAIDRAVARVRRRGVRCVAVSFLFSFLNPDHERRVRERIEEIAPELTVVLSSEVNPEIKEYERASTTVVAAALKPLVAKLLDQLEAGLVQAGVAAPLLLIKSNGGIMSAASARTKPLEMIRSGPAGGVAAALRLAAETGLGNLITIDIGGTTADVAVITGGKISYSQTAELAWDIPIRMAMADVRSIGAGGGSIASLDAAGRLKVGPESAGSRPGPVSYGRGGEEPTVTDAALIAGLLDPERFLGGRMPLETSLARRAIEVRIAQPLGLSTEIAAAGIVHLTGMRMAQLITEMTVQAGLDPRDYTVVGFGGAGPLFSAMLADEISAAGALIPRHPAVWSAMGGLFADIVHDYARSYPAALNTLEPLDLDRLAKALLELAQDDLKRDGLRRAEATYTFSLDIRYSGQSHEISVPLKDSPPFTRDTLSKATADFDDLHERLYGQRRDEPRQMVTLRLVLRVSRGFAAMTEGVGSQALEAPRSARHRQIWLHGVGSPIEAEVHDRESLSTARPLRGPALVEEPQSLTLVPPGMTLRVMRDGMLSIRRSS